MNRDQHIRPIGTGVQKEHILTLDSLGDTGDDSVASVTDTFWAVDGSISSAEWGGGFATIKSAADCGLSAVYVDGESVTISGATPSGYNGTFTIINPGGDRDTFKIAIASDPGVYVSGGAITGAHTAATFGMNPLGYWEWNTNLFFQSLFPTQAIFLIGFLGTTQGGTVTATIKLVDDSGGMLAQGTAQCDNSVDLTSLPAFTYSATFTAPTYSYGGTDPRPATFNGIEFTFTCSNTNLNSLLNYGSFGGGASPSAVLYLLHYDITPFKMAAIG